MLVAPVCEKGRNGRNVRIPEGIWSFEGETIIGDGKEQMLYAEPGVPVVLWKQE